MDLDLLPLLTADRVRLVSDVYPKLRRARLALFNAHSECCWCGSPVLLPDSPEATLGILASNHATLDHLFHLHDPRRTPPHPVVLACHACNQFRARLYSYAWRSWPLLDTQTASLLAHRTAYAARYRAALCAGVQVIGVSLITTEYAATIANLATTSAILSSPSVLPLSPFDLELLVVRAISMSLLPTALLA